LAFAREGASVAILDRDGGTLAATVEETKAIAPLAAGFVADVSDEASVTAAIRAADAALGGIDVLVNNAGVMSYAPVETMPVDMWDRMIAINLRSVFLCSRLVIPGMVSSGAGWILNVSSRAAGPRVGPPYAPNQVAGQCLYGSSKAMLDRLTTGAAMELHPSRIAVNTLAPEAAVRTENADAIVTLPESVVEPAETMAEAALALCTGDPVVMTGRIAYSLSLLVELQRPVHTLDGRSLVPGWQPGEIDPKRLRKGYLAELA